MEHWHPNPDFFFQVGAGPVLDLGPYYVTDLIHLIGPVKRVTAFTERRARSAKSPAEAADDKGTMIKVGTPTTIHGVLEFHSGAIVTIGASWDVFSHGHHNIELYGTEGSVYVPDPNFFGGDIVVTDQSGTKTRGRAVGPPVRQGQPGPRHGDAARQLPHGRPRRHDRSRSTKGRPARCGLDVALHAVDVMTSLLKAGETGEVVTLSTTCERPAALNLKMRGRC